MTTALIRSAFESSVKAWADAQTLAVQVAFENVEFTPPAARYLRVNLLPNQTQSDDLGGAHRRFTGLFQVTACMPIGQGPAGAQAIEAALTALFTTTAPITSGALRIFITEPLSAGPALQEGDRYLVPLTLSYRADSI
jgi:hypothetical protein